MNTIKSNPAPKYNYFVQINEHDDLPKHTLEFLESHATRPLNEISVEEINQFLSDCWGRARWSGDGLSQDCEVGS